MAQDHYHSSGIIASLEAGYQWLPGVVVVIEPQAQVIYQGVQQDDFTAANRARVSQSQGDDIQMRLGLQQRMAYRCSCHTNIRSELLSQSPSRRKLKRMAALSVTMR